MSKQSPDGPDWPDFEEWADRLHAALARQQQLYEAESNMDAKRNKATGQIEHILAALLELPTFASSTVHLPLKDLMFFFSDLDRGLRHPWSHPRNFGGTNITPTARIELKIWVRAAFTLLKSAGFTTTGAYRHIEAGLLENGFTNDGGAKIPWRRIGEWCRQEESPLEAEKRDFLQQYLTAWLESDPTNPIIGNWGDKVSAKEKMGRLVDQFWTMPELRDQSVSIP